METISYTLRCKQWSKTNRNEEESYNRKYWNGLEEQILRQRQLHTMILL